VNTPVSLLQIFARNLYKAVVSLLQQHIQYGKLFSSFICGGCQRLRHVKFLYFDQVAALTVKQNCSLGLAHCFNYAALQQLFMNSGKTNDYLRILFQCQDKIFSFISQIWNWIEWLRKGSKRVMREVTIQRVPWNKFHDHLSILLSSRETRGLHLSLVEFLTWSLNVSLLTFPSLSRSNVQTLIPHTMPTSVHRKVLNTRKTTTNYKHLRPAQQLELKPQLS